MVCFPSFYQWRWRQSKLPYSWKFISDLFFVSIYPEIFLSFIIEHRTMLLCYFPIFLTLYLIYTKKKPSLFLILKGCLIWLIVHVINTSFHIQFPLFVYWKKTLYSFFWLFLSDPLICLMRTSLKNKSCVCVNEGSWFFSNRMVHAIFPATPSYN